MINIYKIIYIIIIIVLYYFVKYLNVIIFNLKVCLYLIRKNEDLYINEFIHYYKNIGYNHIYLFDNIDNDDEKFEDVVKEEVENGFVTIINYKGYRGININPQLRAYKDFYKKYDLMYDWLSFFDIDEYLQLIPPNLKLQHFLNKTNDSLYYENKSLIKRANIPYFNISVNRHIKITVRGNLSKNY